MSDQTNTRRDGSRYGSGESSIARTTLKIALVAPMPSASVTTAAAAKPGDRRRPRSAYRASRSAVSIQEPMRTARTSSLTRARLPTSRRASRRADAGSTPAAVRRSVSRSTCARSSSSRSRSRAAEWKSVCHSAVIRDASGTLRLAEHLRDGERDARPLFLFGGQAPAARRRQLVALDPPSLVVDRPLARAEAVGFEAMQGGKQRAGLDGERAVRDLFEPFGDAEAVPRLELQRAEDQEIQRAFEQLGSRHGRLNIDIRYRTAKSSGEPRHEHRHAGRVRVVLRAPELLAQKAFLAARLDRIARDHQPGARDRRRRAVESHRRERGEDQAGVDRMPHEA